MPIRWKPITDNRSLFVCSQVGNFSDSWSIGWALDRRLPVGSCCLLKRHKYIMRVWNLIQEWGKSILTHRWGLAAECITVYFKCSYEVLIPFVFCWFLRIGIWEWIRYKCKGHHSRSTMIRILGQKDAVNDSEFKSRSFGSTAKKATIYSCSALWEYAINMFSHWSSSRYALHEDNQSFCVIAVLEDNGIPHHSHQRVLSSEVLLPLQLLQELQKLACCLDEECFH